MTSILNLFKKKWPRGAGAGADPDGALFRVAPDVKASRHAGGVVLIHVGRGTVFSANRVGAMIWNGLAEHRSLERIADAISDEFRIPRQTVQQDAAAFLAQLQAEGLLVHDGN